jgi:serralysin
MATAASVTGTNNSEIDGLLSGYKWSGSFTYSFPDASADYGTPYGNGEPTMDFAQVPSQVQAAINYAVGLTLSYTNANIQYAGTNGADIMVAQSPAANPTSYAYYPSNVSSGGDIWFGTAFDYSLASLGNYYFMAALHEVGHAVGLKHSNETGGVANVAVPSVHDNSEYTVMSYRSYDGGPLTGTTNEAYGYPQTYMANDILALQTLYGANYANHSESTVYSWSPTTGQTFINGVAQLAPGASGGSANRIFETVWDGGGVDTYDLSNYTTNLTINLNPGAPSVFSSTQLAYLGNGHYAAGNVYNAYLYNNDPRSYIDSVIGGSGDDTFRGNEIANVLNGGAGNETITGGGGNDTIIGGSGTDTAVYSDNQANYAISYDASSQAFTISHRGTGSTDGTDTVTGVETFQFADGPIDSQVFQSFVQTLPSVPNLAQFGQQNVSGGETIEPAPDSAREAPQMIIPTASIDFLRDDWDDAATINGAADAYARITLLDGTESLGSVKADSDGSWTFRTSALSDTFHTFSAQQIDSTGRVVATNSDKAILGSTRSDTVTSTAGGELIVGDGGSDTFVFAENFGNDVIQDFEANYAVGLSQDTIQFSKSVFDDFASVQSQASQVGQDVVISTGSNSLASTGSNSLALKNATLSGLDHYDFHFA